MPPTFTVRTTIKDHLHIHYRSNLGCDTLLLSVCRLDETGTSLTVAFRIALVWMTSFHAEGDRVPRLDRLSFTFCFDLAEGPLPRLSLDRLLLLLSSTCFGKQTFSCSSLSAHVDIISCSSAIVLGR